MGDYSFWWQGEPRSKMRPRIGAGGNVYTPTPTTHGEQALAWACLNQNKGLKCSDSDIFRVDATFKLHSRQRRDIDNMLKLVLDALTGVVWEDDVQVCEATCRRVFVGKGEEGVAVSIDIDPDAQPVRVARPCPSCGVEIRVFPGSPKNRCCSNACAGKIRRQDKKCDHCGKTYNGRGKSPYCSKDCGMRARRSKAQCSVCGKEVDVLKSTLTKNQAVFCASACRQEFWRPRRGKGAQGTCSTCGGPTSKKVYKQCAQCRHKVRPDAPWATDRQTVGETNRPPSER